MLFSGVTLFMSSVLLLEQAWGDLTSSALGRADRVGELMSLTATENLPASEMHALQNFYESTQGENWLWQTDTTQVPWNFSDPNANPCTDHWQGISCLYEGGEYRYVRNLDLPSYGLNGSLPSTLSQLTRLAELALCNNSLVGPIPDSLGELSELVNLVLCSNALTGSVPESIGGLVELELLICKNNAFTGTLPNTLQSMSNLQELDFAYNALVGTIPEEIAQLTQLTSITLHYNRLVGTIPEVLGGLPQLQVLYLQDNRLHGTVPASLGNLSQLVYLDVDTNELTGTVPESLSNLHLLEIFSMENNRLTGTLPNFLGNYSHLQYLTIFNNSLVGTIPASIGDLPVLFEFSVAHNYLTGTIPRSVSRMPTLNSFIVDHNHISGTLDGVFDAAVQVGLVTVVVNNNQLTGTIPSAIFDLPALTTVVASTNCFHGQLPDNMCNRTSLVSIVFDGLSAAPACKNKLIPGLSDSYTLESSVHGTVPACLFQLPTLLTLHLSGNGFSGSIMFDSTVVSPLLIDLSLSHNVLTGLIPSQLQDKKWAILDLSFNRLQGSLSASLASKVIHLNRSLVDVDDSARMSLSLENNRLSGAIPHSLRDLQDISILGTNTFSCKLDGSDLPQHDSGVSNYQCGSSEFDVPYYVWLGLVFLCAAGVCCAAKFRSALQRYADVDSVALWWTDWLRCVASCGESPVPVPDRNAPVSRLASYTHIQRYRQLMDAVSNHAVAWTAVILVVLLPLYVALSHYYGTHLQAYAWTVSAAYLSGAVPFGLEMVLWLAILCAAMVTMRAYCQQQPLFESAHAASSIPSTVCAAHSSRGHRLALIYLLFLGLNIVIVGGVNVAYVYVSIYRSSQLLTFVQIAMSFFKVIYNGIASTFILRCIVRLVAGEELQISGYASLRALSALINNIVIPFAVVMIVSPSCFYNVFAAAPSVNAVFSYEVCETVSASSTVCDQYAHQPDSSSYDPPFTYSYQCSSSLITYYAPAFVNLCIVSMFVMPMVHLLAVVALRRTDKNTRWSQLLNAVIPATWKLPAVGETPVTTTSVFFNPLKEQLAQLNFVALIFTFGVVFPPLAAALAVTLMACTFITKLKLGRLLQHELGNDRCTIIQSIELACEDLQTSTLLSDFVGTLGMLACFFYTLFLFDTLGDAVGFHKAYWVLIVVPLLSVGAVSAYWLLDHRSTRGRSERKLQGEDQPTAEMTTRTFRVHGSSISHQSGVETFNIMVKDAEAQQ